MKYFYDCEFLEDGETIDPISIAVVAQDGREFYAVNADFDYSKLTGRDCDQSFECCVAPDCTRRSDDWMMKNVVPHLPGDLPVHKTSGRWLWKLDYTNHNVMSLPLIRELFRAFIIEEDREIELRKSSQRLSNWLIKQSILDMQCAVISARQTGASENGVAMIISVLMGSGDMPPVGAMDAEAWRTENTKPPPEVMK